MPSVLRHQPFKSLYFVYTALTLLLVKIPVWAIVNLVPSSRHRASWPLSRLLIVRATGTIVAAVFETCSFGALRDDLRKFLDKPEESGLVWIEPTPELIVGDIQEAARLNGVDAVRVAGFWCGYRDASKGAGAPAKLGEKVIYELHGKRIWPFVCSLADFV